MTRIPRNAFPPFGQFHITNRGVDRCLIYRDEEDYRYFTGLFQGAALKEGLQVYAYCLMPNHYHAVIEARMDAISRVFHRVNGIHARDFNARYGRSGHLFQCRFESWVIESDEQLENACQYVWDNPVRAGLCSNRREWPWSGELLSRPPRRR